MKDEKLIPYHEHLEDLIACFQDVTFSYVPRIRNRFADALATLASMIEISYGAEMEPIMIEQRNEPAFCLQIEELAKLDDEPPQFSDIKNFLKTLTFPEGTSRTDR